MREKLPAAVNLPDVPIADIAESISCLYRNHYHPLLGVLRRAAGLPTYGTTEDSDAVAGHVYDRLTQQYADDPEWATRAIVGIAAYDAWSAKAALPLAAGIFFSGPEGATRINNAWVAAATQAKDDHREHAKVREGHARFLEFITGRDGHLAEPTRQRPAANPTDGRIHEVVLRGDSITEPEQAAVIRKALADLGLKLAISYEPLEGFAETTSACTYEASYASVLDFARSTETPARTVRTAWEGLARVELETRRARALTESYYNAPRRTPQVAARLQVLASRPDLFTYGMLDVTRKPDEAYLPSLVEPALLTVSAFHFLGGVLQSPYRRRVELQPGIAVGTPAADFMARFLNHTLQPVATEALPTWTRAGVTA